MRPLETIEGGLKSNDHDTTLRIGSLRMRIDAFILTQSNVHQTALIRTHRWEAHGTMLTDSTRSGRPCHGDNLVVTTRLITLNIDSDGIAESKPMAH